MGYIYKITNDINNNIYIGQTICDIHTRWTRHLATVGYRSNDLYKAMYDLGISHFHIDIVEECSNNQLNEKERYWINFYDSYEHGYNMTRGGGYWRGNIEDEILTQEIYQLWDEGYAITEIAQELEITRTIVRDRIYSYKNYSEEESIKRGRALVAETKYKKVYQWDLNGKLVNEYNSLKEASEKNNFGYKALSYALTHQGSSNNYYWTYDNNPPIKMNINNTNSYKQVGQYDLEGNLIKIYSSRSEAARENNFDASSICKCCNGYKKSYKGYIWKNN